MPNEFELLYRVQALGTEALDGVSRAQAQINLQTKYSSDALRLFEGNLKTLTTIGYSYRDAINTISRSTRDYGQTVSQVAKDVIANDRARQRSIEETARAAQKAAADEQRAANETYRIRQRIDADERRQQEAAARQADRQSIAGIRAGGSMLGIGGNRMLGTAFGGGISGTVAGLGIGAVVGGAFGLAEMTRDAMQSAQQLTNLANEFGVTTQKMFQFQAAARMSGQDVGTFTQALRRLSEASEDPAGSGKEVVKAMNDLGVSIRQGPGPALDEILKKLNGIQDPARRAADASALFGRSFQGLLEASRNMNDVGANMDANVTQRLADANKVLEQMQINLKILIANLSAKIVIPWVEQFANLAGAGHPNEKAAPVGPLGNPYGMGGFATWMQRTFAPPDNTLDYQGLPGLRSMTLLPSGNTKAAQALLGAGNTRDDIQEQLSAARRDRATAEAKLGSDIHSGADQFTLTNSQKALRDARAQVAQLEAREKALAKQEALNASYPDALARLREAGDTRDLGPFASAQRQRDDFIQKYGSRARIPANQFYAQAYSGTMSQILERNARSMNEEAKRNNEELNRSGWSQGYGYAPMFGAKPIENLGTNGYTDSGAASLLSDNLRRQIEQDRPWAETYRQMVEMGSTAQVGQASRQLGLNRSLRDITGNSSPNADYKDSIAAAKQELDARLEGAKQLETAEQQITEIMKARYDYSKAEDQARITREEQIAKIGQQQSQEAGRFFSGWTMAALSGRPGASTNYLRGFGQDIFSHIVSNTASAVLPNGLNQFTSLASSGILGPDPDHRSLIGRAVAGTPLDWSADQIKKLTGSSMDQHTPLISSQDALRASIDANTIAQGGKPPSGSGAVPGGGLPGSISNVGGGVASLMSAVRSGNPSTILNSVAGLSSAVGGGATQSGVSGFSRLAAMIGPGGTSGFVPGSTGVGGVPHPAAFTAGSGGLPNLDSFFNSLISPNVAGFGSGSISNGALSVASTGGVSPGELTLPSGNSARSAGWTPSLGTIPDVSFGSKIASGANKLSGLIAGTGKMLGSGDALPGILTGNIDYGDGTGAVLSNSQRVAGGIGLGAATYTGVSQAVKDFSKGGARGDIGGIGSAMGTAALYDPDPISKLALTAGSTIMGLVTSLLPDQRQERIKQESRTLVNDMYIRPAARDYNFGGAEGSGGFSMGMGSSLRAGGPSANYTFNLGVHSLDAQTFIAYMKNNPSAGAAALMSGMTDSGVSAVGGQVAWNSQYGGYVPPGGLVAG